MKLSTAVSLRIKELLKQNNMTQYQIYKATGIAQSTLSTIINEVDKTCRLSTILQIAEAFNIGLKEFFDSELFNHNNIEFE